MIALVALLAALAQAAPSQIEVEVWNDSPGEVRVRAGEGAGGVVPHNKEASFKGSGESRSLIVHAGGCDYLYKLPGPLAEVRTAEDWPARLYLSDSLVLYVVPPDLEMQSPPNYLDPKQPIQYPVYPEKGSCG